MTMSFTALEHQVLWGLSVSTCMESTEFVGWAYLYAQIGDSRWLQEADDRVEAYGGHRPFINKWLCTVWHTLKRKRETPIEVLIQVQLLAVYMERCHYRLSDRQWWVFNLIQRKLCQWDWRSLEPELLAFWYKFPIPEDLLLPPIKEAYDNIDTTDASPCFRWDN